MEARGAQPALVLAHPVLERPRPLLRDELTELLSPDDLSFEGVCGTLKAIRATMSRIPE